MRKMRVWEVSFAKRPKTGERFIITKEDVMEKEKLARLVAQLAMQADVPEVVKEELKDLAGEPLQKEEVLELLGLKEEEKYEGIPEQLKKELEERDAKILALQIDTLKKDLAPTLGDKVDLGVRLWQQGDESLFKDVMDYIKTLKKTVDSLGSPKGEDEPPEGAVIEQELEKLMKEGLSRGDALVELAKRRPELIENWR